MKPRRRTGYLDYAVMDNVIFPLLLADEALFGTLIDASDKGMVELVHKQRSATLLAGIRGREKGWRKPELKK
ncbi:hypothetical protein [Paenibacillus sp. P46E]|uniref:hypothetical protein n=1 Tax=Paenibacillus sp. P46E TaxID=1349436 RepID=UPI00093AFA40|nr:hypothetical protein [Paenibacillus sp. P46E]OKP97766.1 hypothetical protein A3849_13755 [Paenibacillus sp. P46E]